MEKQRRRSKSAERAVKRVAEAELRTLEWVHDASGSVITANSRRLRTLPPGDARDVARRDVAADIDRFVDFDVAAKAECVRDYRAHEEPEMKVCGACGLRDPAATYHEKNLAILMCITHNKT